MRYLLELSFNGANYHGWQIQPNCVSVQGTIEKCISTILNQKVSIVGAGRTDTGVHASYFCAHFDFDLIIEDKSDFIYKSNSFLPIDIAIKNIFLVKQDFHARFDAVSRTYQYKINTVKNPFLSNDSYYLKKEIDEMGVRQFLLKNLYWKEKGQLSWRMNVSVLENEMDEILSEMPSGDVLLPTLFIRGALSRYILDEDIIDIENQFPDSEVKTIPNAGHWVHAESPDDFVDMVLAFCLR